MTDLTISHNAIDGTTLEGTSKGDGSAAIVKHLGWRWFARGGVWYVPRSRGQLPNRGLIERTARALGADGFSVGVEIDTAPPDMAKIEAQIAERAEARAEGLTRKAANLQRQSKSAYQRSEDLVAGIPFGQPILAGHHSEAADRRRRERSWDLHGKSIALEEAAQEAGDAAETAAKRNEFRYSPVTVANRIETLAAEARGYERDIKRAPSAERSERLAHVTAQLDYWRQVRAAQIASGEVVEYGPHNVKPGDLVKVNSDWRAVIKCNAKTVRAVSRYGLPDGDLTPWHRITGHRPAGAGETSEVAEAAPADVAS